MSFQITCQYPKGIVFKEHVTGLERKYEQSGLTWWYEILVGWIGLMMTHWVVDRSIATSEESLHIYAHRHCSFSKNWYFSQGLENQRKF